ncbi:MAG: Metal-dependent hydrolase, beta-lactamase superfamily [Mucilaginibacter sp.]|nr:Metal-dependent hydrolase, beta-lactamase superfamily [Mucilaginibacter sp.]
MKLFKIFSCLLFACLAATPELSFSKPGEFMTAHYIDVGQGQAILLEFPKGAVLIDAGAQKDKAGNVTTFLRQFFARRTDLHNTLNAVMVTHQHVDHDLALQAVVQQFKVLNYIDNGQHDPHSSGKKQIWLEQHAAGLGIKYEAITFAAITSGHNLGGLTDAMIDPVSGDTTDPKIVIYSGAFDRAGVTWGNQDFKDPNNHSLVIKVTFGKASFLFMGDLEKPAIATVLNYYHGTGALHAGVLQVGHHGSANATTDDWVKAVAPHYAVISCGHWDFGVKLPDSTATRFTTYAYAHPNKQAIDILQTDIPDLRTVAINERIGVKGTAKPTVKPVFTDVSITHMIYATAWNGNIAIKATADGTYSIVTDRDR